MVRVVIGLGHPDRGDDAAGVLVARRLRSVASVERADCSDLMDLWDDADDVTVVDAMRSSHAPGSVVRFDASSERLPIRNFASSHSFGLAEVVELARALNRLPPRLWIYGIEGVNFEMGSEMSPSVEEAVSMVVNELEGLGD